MKFAPDEKLRRQILRGYQMRQLQNISIKLGPVQIRALCKIATRKTIPSQSLIRQWQDGGIRRKLRLSRS